MYNVPKSREVSIEQRAQVLALHEAGNLMRTIFFQLHISCLTEHEIINRLVKPKIYCLRHTLGMSQVTFRHMNKLIMRF